MKAHAFKTSGFTLVEIMIVVAIIAVLAAIAVPNFVKARTLSQTDVCIGNLRQIDNAAQTYALENNKQPGDTYTLPEIQSYINRGSSGSIPVCPAGGSYTPLIYGLSPQCSIGGTHVLQ